MPIHTSRREILAGLFALIAAPCAAMDPAILAAAQREGTVTWYSGLIVNQVVRPLVAGFEAKYPGIKVQAGRVPSGEAALKVINEARAGRPVADMFDGTAVTHRLAAAGVIERYKPEAAQGFPDRSRDPNGDWTALNTYIMTPAINTEMVTAAEAPKTLQDLLDPKWRGRIAWTNDPTTTGAPGFIGSVLTSMGQQAGMAYLKQLAQQRIVNVPGSQRVVLDQVIGGQYPLALMTFNYHSVISANDGAPVRWLPVEPAVEVPNPVGLIRNAPHPNAAKLLIEYVLSGEGQRVLRDANYLPANPTVPPRDPALTPAGGHFASVVFTPEITAAKLDEWTAIYNELFK